MKCPLVRLTLCFCLGIVTDSIAKIPFILTYTLAIVLLLCGFVFVKRKLLPCIIISCCVFFLGASLLRNYSTIPGCHIFRLTYTSNNSPYLIKGFVENQPIFRRETTSFILETQEIQSANIKYNCCGKILVYVKGREDLSYGEELLVQGNFYKLANNFDLSTYPLMRLRVNGQLARLSTTKGTLIKKAALQLKCKMKEIISKYTSPLTSDILSAMILGEQRYVPVFIYNSMVLSGTVHVLVVSGFNVGIIAFIVNLMLKFIRFPRKLRYCITFTALIIYCLMTGASNPVVRATVMAGYVILGYLIRREPDIYSSLSLAAIFILAINPLQLFEIGFQLSFVSVFSIVYLYPKIKALLRIEQIKRRYLRYMFNGCLVSVSAWLGTMGLIAYRFRIFSTIAVVANVFIVPLATLITICGLSLIFIGLICPSIAPFFAANCELLVHFLIKINSALIKIPYATFRL